MALLLILTLGAKRKNLSASPDFDSLARTTFNLFSHLRATPTGKYGTKIYQGRESLPTFETKLFRFSTLELTAASNPPSVVDAIGT